MKPMLRKLLRLLVTGSLVLLSGATPPPASPAGSSADAPYTLLQMNLCLSGLAGCNGGNQYPNVVEEAIEQINTTDPDAITLNEACRGDVERIASETGYHARFAIVDYGGAPLSCVAPGDRGVFGNAVLTKQPIKTSTSRPFAVQGDPEQRRWICVETEQAVTVCASHLSTRGWAAARAANDDHCAVLEDVLSAYGAKGPTIFAGDMNRQGSCAPPGMWTLTDVAAEQSAGVQHSYGTTAHFDSPTLEIEPATWTDHDFMVVRSRLKPTDDEPRRHGDLGQLDSSSSPQRARCPRRG